MDGVKNSLISQGIIFPSKGILTERYIMDIAAGKFKPVKSADFQLPNSMKKSITELTVEKVFKFIESKWNIFKYYVPLREH